MMDPQPPPSDDLNPVYKEYMSLSENMGQKILLLDVKATVLAGAYVLFLIIMYVVDLLSTAVLHGSLWMPLCLLALVSVAFWPAFINTVNDCVRIREQQESTLMEQQKVFVRIKSGRSRRDPAAARRSLVKALEFVRRQRYAYVRALHFALSVFALLVSYELLIPIPGSIGGVGFLPRHQYFFTLEVPPSAVLQLIVHR